MTTFRGFYALPLDRVAVRGVMNLRSGLEPIARAAGLRLRWVSEEQLHVTLKFLGTVQQADVQKLARLGEEAARSISMIATQTQGVHVFGRPRRARVLHLPVADPESVIEAVAARLESGVVRLGFERRQATFHPHITLARFRPAADATPLLSAGSASPIDVRLEHLVLYASTPTREGSVYHEVGKWRFLR